MKIQKLQSLRLVLIVTAVILAIFAAVVAFVWIPSEVVPALQPTETTQGASPNIVATEPQETQAAETQPAETQPAETQAAETQPEQTQPKETQPTEPPTEESVPPSSESTPDPTRPSFGDTPPADGNSDDPNSGITGVSLTEGAGFGTDPQTTGGGNDEDSNGEGTAAGGDGELQSHKEAATEPVTEPVTEPTAAPTEAAQTEPSETAPVAEAAAPVDPPAANDISGGETPEKKIPLTATPGRVALLVLLVLLAADVVGIVVVSVVISSAKKKAAPSAESYPATLAKTQQSPARNGEITIGSLHNIGARPYQEDSYGVSRIEGGVLAVVADGMGGLSGGDKVSQTIVKTMLAYGDKIRPGMIDGVLERMVYGTNETVNAMLGPSGLYKSGSTLLTVLVRDNRFHWITVGDSHIYFYHAGKLTQLNEEHNRGQELLHRAARGEITYEEARNDPKKNGLTSFIGMGKLKYVDKSLESIPITPGDRILLMTDGVFNALSDQTIAAVLEKCPNVEMAAAEMERLVIRHGNPRQDNFTAVILGF